MPGVIVFLSLPFFFLGAAPFGGRLGWLGARASPDASPSGSMVGAARIEVFRLHCRSLSSEAARARAFGLPSPLNVHRFFLRQGAPAWWRTVPDTRPAVACPSPPAPKPARGKGLVGSGVHSPLISQGGRGLRVSGVPSCVGHARHPTRGKGLAGSGVHPPLISKGGRGLRVLVVPSCVGHDQHPTRGKGLAGSGVHPPLSSQGGSR